MHLRYFPLHKQLEGELEDYCDSDGKEYRAKHYSNEFYFVVVDLDRIVEIEKCSCQKELTDYN